MNLICVEDGIDSSKDSRKFTITILSEVTEIERENILVQTMEGRKQKTREGKWNGGQASFGYKLDKENDVITVDPEYAEVVKIIFEKYVHEDMGLDKICNYLNQHGYSKEKTRPQEVNYFTRTFLARLLDNPFYIGKIAYGKSSTEKVKGTRDQYRRVKTDNPIIVDGMHEAIISEELWQAAQEKRKQMGVRWNKTHSLEHEHILSGLVKCPVCGRGLVGTLRRRKNKKSGEYKDDFYYKCLRRQKLDDEHFCNYRLVLNQDELNAQVEAVIQDMISDEAFKGYIKEILGRKVDVSKLEEDREKLRSQLRQLIGAKQKLSGMLDALDINDRHYDRKYQDMQDRLDNLYDKLSELEDAIHDVNDKINVEFGEPLTAQELYKVLENWDTVYYKMTDMEKKEFYQNFVEQVIIYPDRKTNERIVKQIDFKFPVYYDGDEGKAIRLLKQTTVETVALLSKLDVEL